MCFRLPIVPKFRSPTLTFLLSFVVFYNRFLSLKNVFSFKTVFVAAYINACALQSADNTSAKIKLLANKYEGATSVTPRDRLENVDIPVLFYKKYFRQIKLFQKLKK